MAILKLWSAKDGTTVERPAPLKPESRLSGQPTHRFKERNNLVDLEELRARLRKMTDAELRRYGQATHYSCSSHAKSGESARNVFIVQLEECRAEWRRRHPPK